MRNTAGQLEELGEDASGAAVSVTRLQTQLLNLTGGKVNIMKSATEFKSTFNIIQELSQVWDSLTDVAQADITRLVAGTNRANAFQSLLGSVPDMVAAAETSLGSFNSALIENERILSSYAGKAAQIEASFQTLANNIVEDSVIKWGMDVANVLLGVANAGDAFLVKMAGLPVVILGVSAAMKTFGETSLGRNMGDIFNGFLNTLQGIKTYYTSSKNIKDLSKDFKALGTNIAEQAKYLTSLSASERQSVLTIHGVSSAERDLIATKLETIATLRRQIIEMKTFGDAEDEIKAKTKELATTEGDLNKTLSANKGISTGAAIGSSIITGLFTVINSYSAGKQAEESGEAFASGFTNAAMGAISGAGVGSTFGPHGALIGAISGFLLSGVSSGLGYFSVEAERAITKSNELLDSFKQQKTELSDVQSTINSLADEYATLSRGVDPYGVIVTFAPFVVKAA